jgi:DNA helicase-2/ATP-dependent DNA helicase PcrA
VDEFQDTNNIQYELIRLLVGDHRNLFIVGDEDQSIYAFRGANIENICKFKKDFPEHHLVMLEQNYRSTNTILEAANHIITNNTSRIPKNLFSTKGKGDRIVHYKAVTARDEVEYVAMTIQSMVRKGYTYNDFAILYRINSTSRMFEDVFLQKQIPYRIYGNLSFFQRREIKDLTAYLRYILNPDDAFSFQRCVAMPRRGIGPTTIERVIDYCATEGVSFSEAIRSSEQFLGKSAAHKLSDFDQSMRHFRQLLDELPFSDFIDELLDKTGYLDLLKQDEKGDVRYENLLEFKTILAEHNELYGDMDKEEMLTYILEDIALKSEENKEDVEDGVTMLTLHAAKGLEFRVVFIVALEMGMFPMARAFGDRFEFEEERRLMYVGVTRAKEKLFLTNADTRQTWGETSRNPDSKFLDEIPSELLHKEGYSVVVDKSKNTNDIKNKPSYQRQIRKKRESLLKRDNQNDLGKGDKVSHKVFGDGIVVRIDGDHCVIAFPVPYGIKTLLKDHPAIVKKS